MEEILAKLKALFLLEDNEVDYIRKQWAYDYAAESTSMSYGVVQELAEARENVAPDRMKMLSDILATYVSALCPKCQSVLLYNDSRIYVDMIYRCEVCKVELCYDLKEKL